MREIYFDNAATSHPKREGVSDAMKYFLDELDCNVGRGAYEKAIRVSKTVLDTRARLCELFDAEVTEENVAFTANVTQSLNTVMKGLIKKGDHFLITGMEHNAVARPARELEKRGAICDIVPCGRDGMIDLAALENLLGEKTKAVCALHASNVSGTVMPIGKIGEMCRKHGAYFVLDTAQTAGMRKISMREDKIDALCFTGHKSLGGPQGIGGFILGPGMPERVMSLIEGGTGSVSESVEMPDFMPDKFESGTENLPGIFGLHAALEALEKNDTEAEVKKEMLLTEMFAEGIMKLPHAEIAGGDDIAGRCPIVSVDFTGMDNAEIAGKLAFDYGIMTRVGMHCAPLAHKSLGTYPQGTVRFSFSPANTEEEIRYAIGALKDIAGKE